MESPYSTLKHAIAMFWKCDVSRRELNDISFLMTHFRAALESCQTIIIKMDYHEFEPEGITVIAILADSHAILHTWPETSFVMAEIFTCGKRSSSMAGIKYLLDVFKPKVQDIQDKIIKI
ncbi:MAG TPA: adenosylmethionine decarboxylase [Candidatus Lokiarchaeia archaeon]|nr:adenosylmethionine decarboxylase [Candidatus Lokiarchaeia archaeon]